MTPKKWIGIGLAVVLLALYNGSQPDLEAMRTMNANDNIPPSKRDALQRKLQKERYGPSMAWLDRLMNANSDKGYVKLNFNVLSSMMVAGLASGFKSQVANLLWMKSDEYWHEGLLTRQVPLMEAVVTLDPQFVDAWSTAGWHWAYNIYADVEQKYKGQPDKIRTEQDHDVAVGIDYLRRGADMNPETYRLWFEQGWTRAEKAGLYDEDTINLYRTARAQGDARNIEVGGKIVQGMDIIGRTIGHIYEKTPDFDKALHQYGGDLLKATPQQLALLDSVGDYWRRYSSSYTTILDVYNGGDATVKARVRQLVPDIDHLIAAQAMRDKMANSQSGAGGQPTGAYISIYARYIPCWRLMKQGKLQDAVNNIIGVMNGDPKYILQGLPTLAKIMELRGDAPAAIQAQMKQLRNQEGMETQDIGLHTLAHLYELQAAQEHDPTKQKAIYRQAYETWYRSRERDQLDYYARHSTRIYEDKFHFTPPQQIIDAIKKSRRTGNGSPEAAPTPDGGSETGNLTGSATKL